MTDYTFETLNDKEFEELSKDLLEIELGVRLQSFKTGRDGGIDLRYSKDYNNEIVIQAKHYIKSGFSILKSKLIKEELPKIKKLKPRRYILVVSMGLSPQQVSELKDILDPFVKNENDIYWRQSLNSILSENEKIERKYYKLWLSSTTVLNAILNNSSFIKNSYTESEIRRKASIYVQTVGHNKAIDILKKRKVLLITGSPGVGKSTLAELLINRYLSQGYELLTVEDKIIEAENLLSTDFEKKQLVYFDDFLGANIYEILNPRNSETSLIKFINRIQASKNKRLILTSRTTILNQALSSFEKFRRERIDSRFNFEVNLSDYSDYDKAKILYNHLYFGELQEHLVDAVFENKNYLNIIKHKNYNPRLIEFITKPYLFEGFSKEEYLNQIAVNLEKPNEIWEGSYSNQLNIEDQFLLTTLFSMGGSSSLPVLVRAFKHRINYEIKENGFQLGEDVFNKSLKKLLKGYLASVITKPPAFNELNSDSSPDKSDLDSSYENRQISFINPSIGDFLLHYLNSRPIEKNRILYSTKYFYQLNKTFHPDIENIKLSEEEINSFFQFFKENENHYESIKTEESRSLELLYIYVKFFGLNRAKHKIALLLEQLDVDGIKPLQKEKFLDVLLSCSNERQLKSKVVTRWIELIKCAYNKATSLNDLEVILDLFIAYDISFKEFLETDNSEFIYEKISTILSDYIHEGLVDNYTEYSYSEDYEMYDEGYAETIYTLDSSMEEEAREWLSTLLREYDHLKLIDMDLIDLMIDYDDVEHYVVQSYNEYMMHNDDDDERIDSSDRTWIDIDKLFSR